MERSNIENMTEYRQQVLVKRFRKMADKIESMSYGEFNNYEDILSSFESDMTKCEYQGYLDNTHGQIEEEVLILTFINSNKERGKYTVD